MDWTKVSRWDEDVFFLDLEWLERSLTSRGKVVVGSGDAVYELAWGCVKGAGGGGACVVSTGWNESYLRYASIIRLLVEEGGYDEVWCYDHRSQGLSSRSALFDASTTHVESFEEYLDDARTMLDFFNMSKVDVVAHSMGGAVWLATALRYPDRVGRCVLCAPMFAGKFTIFPSDRRMDQRSFQMLDACLNLLPEALLKLLAVYPGPRSACLRGHPGGEAALQGLLRRRPEAHAPKVTKKWLAASAQVYPSLLALCSTSMLPNPNILVLSAQWDYMVFNEAHDDIATLLSCRTLMFENASHELLHERASVRVPVLQSVLAHLKKEVMGVPPTKKRHRAALDEKFLLLPAPVAYAAAIAGVAILAFKFLKWR